MSKNVAVFVDVANVFYAAKAAGTDIDYVTLLKAAVAGRDFVRAYAYTGLDPENENQRNFHEFLRRHGYKVVTKDIRKYGDGKVKANLDIELVVDMLKTARNLDVAIVVSGDGDFASAIRAVQEMGVRVEVISFRGNTSSDLMDVADVFYDITQLAKVDKDSSRSGRRVADDEEDLSMTEVPQKQTEGRGDRRRGRGRRGRAETAEETTGARRGGRGGRGGEGREEREEEARSGGQLVALPGERLSKAATGGAESAELAEGEAPEGVQGQAAASVAEGEVEAEQGTGRRRRRRGGRGRGHGRGQESFIETGETEAAEFEEIEPVPPANRPNQFGSVWDSQIGMADRPESLAPVAPEDDEFAEPEIPEYLLAERRRGNRGRSQGGGRGIRSAYASAVERERFGRSGGSRYPEPARGPQPQRGPRRDDRQGQQRPQRQPQSQPNRGGGQPRQSAPRSSDEPWSEVPPEIEELLRAQLSARTSRPAEPQARVEAGSEVPAGARHAEAPAAGSAVSAAGSATPVELAAQAVASAKAPRRGGRRKAAGTESAVAPVEALPAESAPAAPRTRTRRKAAVPAEAGATPEAKPARRTRKGAATAAETAPAVEAAATAEAVAPKKRTVRRKPAEPAEPTAE